MTERTRNGRDRQGAFKFEIMIEELPLSVKTYRMLKRAGVLTLSDMTAMSPNELRVTCRLPQRSIVELLDALNTVSVPACWLDALLIDAATVGGLKRLPDPKPSPYVVYFMQCEGFVKIGMSAGVDARLCGIQTSTPFLVELLTVIRRDSISEMASLEDELHQRFSAFHHKREWFRYEGELRDYVEALRANGPA